MKANKVHLLQLTDKEIVDNSEDFTHPVFAEIAQVLSEKDLLSISVSKNDDIFVNLLDFKVRKVVNVLKRYFTVVVTDVTSLVKKGKIQTEYPDIEFITPKFFKKFRVSNMTKDDVLDKIVTEGIESLDSLDKKILKN